MLTPYGLTAAGAMLLLLLLTGLSCRRKGIPYRTFITFGALSLPLAFLLSRLTFALSNILLWLPIGHWSTSAKITVISIIYCLYMVWQLYRSEFFTFSLVTASAGVVFYLIARTSYMANRIAGSILLALILIGTALTAFLCAKNRGRLRLGSRTLRLFPDGFNPLLFYFICVLWAVVLIACLLFGSGFAFYAMFAAIAVELIGAVYYTFQLK